MLGHLSWRELLRRWSRDAVRHAEDIGLALTAEMRSTGWIGGPPAGAGALDEAERRIGRVLPTSYRRFLELTDGWPVTSMEFGALRPSRTIGWVADLKPELVSIWREPRGEWPSDANDGPPLLERSLLLSSGSDNFLLDPGRIDPTGEWASCGFTNWYPGAGKHQPSFRAGMEEHYAAFVRFQAPESETHAEVAQQVDSAYRASLRGDRGQEDVFESARSFGSLRADVLAAQVHELTGRYRAALAFGRFDLDSLGPDSTVLDDLLPLFVAACLNRRDKHQRALDRAWRGAPAQYGERLRQLAAQYQDTGGLDADFSYAPGFASGVDRARTFIRAGHHDEAFAEILAALPLWKPLSSLHLAPMGLLWDREIGPIVTHERRQRLLSSPRTS
ncbi:SMI1/KNR4 family protein [Frankia sp. CNm7]|uniref:SMI1/KNR4 family protein n=1 Tax=Frankia nepalensis TaxID=1836974 RepID=UPI0019323994|nr:SMI1/KNR4 family protein [Frankia nepalensis]MBL7521502.1 SMI1/KNR4 family protein [Frankia nepalensis]